MGAVHDWLWLATREKLSRRTMHKLVEHFGSPGAVFEASRSAFQEIGLRREEQEVLSNKSMAWPNRIADACARLGIWIMTYQDADYPERLRNIYDPPCVLYGKGDRALLAELPAVAIVGTRKCSDYGKRVASALGFQLARRGMLVVTGLARGIDTQAATGALRAGRPTIGVLGGGIDVVYPRENKKVYQDVADRGLLLSEYPPGTRPLGPHFPVRNRIMSGLSLGVVIVEGDRRSGALITARHALEQGRDVFAIPGNIDAPLSVGPNRLLRDGAIPVLETDDIIREYIQHYPDQLWTADQLDQDPGAGPGTQRSDQSERRRESAKIEVDKRERNDYIDLNDAVDPFTDIEKAVLRALEETPLQAEDLATRTQIPSGQLLSTLTLLELRGVVTQTPGKCFHRNGTLRE